MIYRLIRKQKLPITIDKAWAYFSNPGNLNEITPSFMNFRIITNDNSLMYPGQIISYKVSPMFGISIKWVTEITHVVEKKYFVDEQRFGPFSLWHHKHFFNAVGNEVEMIDIVDYKIPLGILGRIVHFFIVKKKVNEIFNYRYQKLEQLFNEKI